MLTDVEMLNGVMTTIIVIISIINGTRIGLRYRTEKQKVFILFGVTWIGMSQIYIPIVVSFWGIYLFGVGLSLQQMLFIDSLVPITIFIGVWAWTELIFRQFQKIILLLTGIMSSMLLIYFLFNTFINPTELGVLDGSIDMQYGFVVLGYLLFTSILAQICGYTFYRECMESREPETRLKGVLIWIAFIMYFSGTLLDGFTSITIASILISRTVLMFGSATFFFGFYPPKKLQEYVKMRIENKKRK